ncbi:unnamed protein product [Urochloa decumbens]|uniref:Uncharacterized protein n=1 Tax=Urochloa decumbens TaxID=240449 RepID=A0ABC9C2W6_9POAL
MADIEAETAPPQAPPKRMAAAAAALRGLLSLATDVAIFGFLATLWLSNAANAAAVAVRWACGEDSRAAAFVREFAKASSFTTALLFVAALLLLLRRRASRNAVAREIDEDEGRPATQSPENTRGRRHRDGLCGPVTTPILAFFLVLVAVGVLMEELAPGKGSCASRVGSMLTDIGCFLTSVLFCFVIFPNFLINLRPPRTKVNSS